MQPIDIDYIGVLDYLANNQEIPYSNPDAENLTVDEKNNLLAIKKKGQNAVAEMKKMAARCKTLYGLDRCLPGSWLDGSNTKTRKYLWTQMKYKEQAENPISISLFVEKNDGAARYRISLEIKNDGVDKKIMKKYHSHLDIPPQPGMVYVSGNNEWGNPSVITGPQEDIKVQVEDGRLRKVQLCIYVETTEGKTNEEFDAEIMEAVDKILPYYEHVIDKAEQGSGRAWLLTWNPDNWPWKNYKEQCVATKQGETCIIPWTCSNKHPVDGDEVFLIKTGNQPRGIIAHGRVAKEAYQALHYSPEKAAQGVMARHIDAEYDWIQDYETENMLLQDDLNKHLTDQQWSPMGSGIEIKTEVLPELRKMWKALIGAGDGYWPSYDEYPVDLTKDDWRRFIEDVEYPSHKGCMRVLKCFLDIGGVASPKILSDKYKGHPTVYTSSVYNTSRRALDYFKKAPCPDGEVKRVFPIAFLGQAGKAANSGAYVYKMRNELWEALKEMDLTDIGLEYKKGIEEGPEASEFDKNMILYGPPGTGKTYNTAIYAVAICTGKSIEEVRERPYKEVMDEYNKLKKAGRIVFTTFHQSYGYEEFIEGIKPIVDQTKKEVGYTVEPGVFKKFCDDAKTIQSNETGTLINAQAQIWKLTIMSGEMNPVKQECFHEGNARMGFDYDTSDARAFVEDVAIGDIILSFKTRKTIDGIGVVTGDIEELTSKETYQLSRKVTWLATNIDENITSINGDKLLHRMTFAKAPNMQLKDILDVAKKYSLNEKATEVVENEEPYVFIIDEINRGNISKIFGELITLIEGTKRAGMEEAASAVLPYSGDTFSVPSNVYILGTMNTADRSIALMDTALRRRFQFIEMLPDANVLRKIGADKVEDLDVAAMLETINERITFLYDREHTIGHAFFTKLAKDSSIHVLSSIFEECVIPLLQEYFYEDYQKIQLVLGDNGKKEDDTKFILDEDIRVKDIFKGNADDIVDLPEKKYSINKVAIDNIEAYKQIM